MKCPPVALLLALGSLSGQLVVRYVDSAPSWGICALSIFPTSLTRAASNILIAGSLPIFDYFLEVKLLDQIV